MQSTTDDRMPQFIKWLENESHNISICDRIEWNRLKNTVQIEIEVMGTQFNNRSELIENVHMGDSLKIVRDADNYYDKYTLSVCNMEGQELGTIWVNLADKLSPLLDAGLAQITACHVKRVEHLSKRGEGAAKAILSIEFFVHLMQYSAAGVVPDTSQETAVSRDMPTLPPTPIKQPVQSTLPQSLSESPAAVCKKTSRTWLFVLVAGILIWITLIGGGVYYSMYVYIPSKHYEKGCELYEQEKYLLAVDEFRRADDYLDAKERIEKCYEQLTAD